MININENPIKNIRYADDMIAKSQEDLQSIVNTIVAATKQKGLTLNANKTKFIVI